MGPSRKEGQEVWLPPPGFHGRSQASFCPFLDDKPFKIAVRQPEACALAFIITDEEVWYATWCGLEAVSLGNMDTFEKNQLDPLEKGSSDFIKVPAAKKRGRPPTGAHQK